MIFWSRIRRDRAQAKVRPSGGFRRARRLSMEQCETRRMLSGTQVTLEVTAEVPSSSGGFLVVDSTALADANPYVFFASGSGVGRPLDWGFIANFDGDQFQISSLPTVTSRNSNTLVPEVVTNQVVPNPIITNQVEKSQIIGLPHGEWSGIILDQQISHPVGSQLGNPNIAESAISNPSLPVTIDPANLYLYPSQQSYVDDFDSTGLDVDAPVLVETPTDASPVVESPISVAGSLNNSPDPIAGDSSGLSGGALNPLVIDEPIQIAAPHDHDASRPPEEGGAIQVFAAVSETQRAYEAELAAVVVDRLNDEGVLPAPPARQQQPVLAQLARAAAFELVSYQSPLPSAHTNQHSRASAGASHGTPESANRETVVPKDRTVSAGEPTQDTSTDDANVTLQQPISPRQSSSSAADTQPALAERVENERDVTLATTFATWPMLASVVAGYLLVERRPQSREDSVQTPPRRPHRSSRESV